jgi:excisionase family DNA binding protein
LETSSELTDLSDSERIAVPTPSTRVPRTGRPERPGRSAADDGPPWLTISEASALVGVSEATLRRWAEAGDVEAFVTPGGHRRFRRRAILDLLPRPRRPHRTLRQLGETPERVVRQYRRELTSPAATWLPPIDEAHRAAFREGGRQLLAGVLAYLDAPNEAAGAAGLDAARAAAETNGRLAGALGIDAPTTAETFLRFRSPFLEELATIVRRRRVETSEAISLIIAAASVFDRLLRSLLEGHAAAFESAPSQPASESVPGQRST